MSKKYSAKSSALFLLVAIAVLGLFGFLTSNTDLFKGQLSLNGSTPAVQLELLNCGIDECSNPSFIVNSLKPLANVELLVKRAADGKIVFADYLTDVETDSRYEVAFAADICGDYTYDTITGRYNQDTTTACTASLYDLIVSGVSTEAGSPLFLESTTFTLTE